MTTTTATAAQMTYITRLLENATYDIPVSDDILESSAASAVLAHRRCIRRGECRCEPEFRDAITAAYIDGKTTAESRETATAAVVAAMRTHRANRCARIDALRDRLDQLTKDEASELIDLLKQR